MAPEEEGGGWEEEDEEEEEEDSGAELKEVDIIAGARGRLGVCLSLFARRSRQFLKVPLAARQRLGEGVVVGLCLRDLRFVLLLLVCFCLLVSVYTLPVYMLCTHTPWALAAKVVIATKEHSDRQSQHIPKHTTQAHTNNHARARNICSS